MRYPDNEGGYIRGHRAAPRKVFTIEKQAFRESPAPGADDHLLPIEPTGVRHVLIKLNELGAMIQPTQAIATTRDAMRSPPDQRCRVPTTMLTNQILMRCSTDMG